MLYTISTKGPYLEFRVKTNNPFQFMERARDAFSFCLEHFAYPVVLVGETDTRQWLTKPGLAPNHHDQVAFLLMVFRSMYPMPAQIEAGAAPLRLLPPFDCCEGFYLASPDMLALRLPFGFEEFETIWAGFLGILQMQYIQENASPYTLENFAAFCAALLVMPSDLARVQNDLSARHERLNSMEQAVLSQLVSDVAPRFEQLRRTQKPAFDFQDVLAVVFALKDESYLDDYEADVLLAGLQGINARERAEIMASFEHWKQIATEYDTENQLIDP